MINKKLTRAYESWQFLVVCVWVVVSSASTLKAQVPNIHWYFTLAVFLLLWPRIFVARTRLCTFTQITGGALILSIIVIAPFSARAGYQFIEAGKLAIILLIVVPTMLARSDTIHGLLAGAALAAAANAAFVFAGLLGVSGALSLMAVGRYGTFLNTPGSLWRVGILVLLPSSLNLLLGRSFWWPLALFASSVALLIFDGSRTAGISMVMAIGFILYFTVREISSTRGIASRKVQLRVAILITVLGGAVVWKPIESSLFTNVGFGDRIGDLFSAAANNGVEGIGEADEGRAAMLKTSIDTILDHPFVGPGMGTTSIETGSGPEVIHDAYLQVWGDVGIIGFISYLFLTVGAPIGPWARPKAIPYANIGVRIDFFNGVYILSCWVLSSLFHPLSTELTEWIMFIVGLAGLHVPSSRTAPHVGLRFKDSTAIEPMLRTRVSIRS